jgi:hypothetical protein
MSSVMTGRIRFYQLSSVRRKFAIVLPRSGWRQQFAIGVNRCESRQSGALFDSFFFSTPISFKSLSSDAATKVINGR